MEGDQGVEKTCIVPLRLLQEPLTGEELRLLLYLMCHDQGDGRVSISRKQMAMDLGKSTRLISRLISTLEQKVQGSRIGSPGQPNVIVLNNMFKGGLNKKFKGQPRTLEQKVQGSSQYQVRTLSSKKKKEKSKNISQKSIPWFKIPEKIQEALDKIDLQPFRDKWEPQGVDVDACWEDFCECALSGTAKKLGVNPYNWKQFSKAFGNSCKFSLAHGLHRRTNRPGPRPWED